MNSRHGIINKLQVITPAGFIEFRRLFTRHLACTVIIDDMLFQLVGTGCLRENVRVDDHIPVTGLVEVGIHKVKMLFPVRHTVASARGIQLVVTLLVRIEKSRSRGQAVIGAFFGKLHADCIHLERVRRK